MFDSLFNFVDPIIEPTEDSLFDFIAQVDSFFDEMEKDGKPLKIHALCQKKSISKCGCCNTSSTLATSVSFELLDKYEEILGIPPHSGSA